MEEFGHHKQAMDHAGTASAEQGKVLLDGPDGVAITMTPDAAEGTARSLLAAAKAAKLQESED